METFYPQAKKIPHDLTLLGVHLHRVDEVALNQFVGQVVGQKQQAIVSNVNIHCMILSQKNHWLSGFLNDSQVVYCDGDGVRWGCQLIGEQAPPKVGFTRWIWSLAAYAEREGLSFFLLGAKPGVGLKAKEKLLEKHPKLKVVGVRDGYFNKEGLDNDKVVNEINEVRPDILIVGFGMPYQEEWLSKNAKNMKVHVFLPGGGVIDYAAGMLGTAPDWMLKMNLEWLFRIYEEPKRLFWRYAIEIPTFFYYIFKTKLFGANTKDNDRHGHKE